MSRVLVCGGRDFANAEMLYDALDSFGSIELLISGAANGADYLAESWARERSIKIECYEADWRTYGKAAGPIRNQRMIDEGKPDLVIAFPGGRGTQNMMDLARKAGIEVIEVQP